jgi:hypothetical protein
MWRRYFPAEAPTNCHTEDPFDDYTLPEPRFDGDSPDARAFFAAEGR